MDFICSMKNDNPLDNMLSDPFTGNSDDIGREKKRERRRWFLLKYYASVMNIRDFMADSIGREFCGVVAKAVDDKSTAEAFNF